MEITQRTVGGVTVLALKGRLVTEDGDAVRLAIDTLVHQGRVEIVVDLQEVTYIDSSGLGLLVSKYVSVRRAGGDVKLIHLTPRSSHLFAITHLTQVFEVFDSEAEAVRAFGSSPSQAQTV